VSYNEGDIKLYENDEDDAFSSEVSRKNSVLDLMRNKVAYNPLSLYPNLDIGIAKAHGRSKSIGFIDHNSTKRCPCCK